jgi:peptidoglycan/xylan/chitin deacetylase (PgdA/CDA1 family)
VDDLFRTRVSRDEATFAAELYMTVDELGDAMTRGVAVGAHGDRHLRLPSLRDAEQAKEIDGALRVLDAVAVPRRRFLYSYANGEHDDRSAARLDANGCAAAFTTRPEIARLVASERLRLPRLDTNDLLQLVR